MVAFEHICMYTTLSQFRVWNGCLIWMFSILKTFHSLTIMTKKETQVWVAKKLGSLLKKHVWLNRKENLFPYMFWLLGIWRTIVDTSNIQSNLEYMRKQLSMQYQFWTYIKLQLRNLGFMPLCYGLLWTLHIWPFYWIFSR